MQCYTRAHRYPRTTTLYDYRAPPLTAYKKRPFFRPEPDKIGRPWCPDGVVLPPPWENIKRVQYNPLNELHRESHMEEMLEFMNKTNWMGGQDMEVWGARKSRLSDSMKFSVQSTQRADYPGHWMGVEPRRNPLRHAKMGTTPATYHVEQYIPPPCHPLTLKSDYVTHAPPEDPNCRCQRITVPHYILEPYPGPQLPAHYRSRVPHVETVARMGLVQ